MTSGTRRRMNTGSREGLTPAIIDKLSKEKHDPVWMQQFRLQSLQIYNEMKIPDWGPSIEGLRHGSYRYLCADRTQRCSAKLDGCPAGHQGYL